ncbi:bifunctional pyr operon transcriptional regulator/uracil phosphoribosyltransferase PyrR [Butyricicoccus sp. 1XD8-22]|nr:bifunctional pyr operon transcriptional regulator/uracil phosphoribosyltransferase PyrR [Butyricicoccus sp. 1XD8-22]
MQDQTIILDEGAISRALTRISFEILEKNHGVKGLLLAGIRTRGEHLAERLSTRIAEAEGARPPVIALDVRPLRDDLPPETRPQPSRLPPAPPGLAGCTVVLVDDVLYTGRTAIAAIEAVRRMGRAERVQLAALVDRGHRELPIRADYVGKNVPTARSERVNVHLREVDGEDAVVLTRAGKP